MKDLFTVKLLPGKFLDDYLLLLLDYTQYHNLNFFL